MKFYGIDVQGYIKLKEYDHIPTYNPSTDERRLIYVKDGTSNVDSLLLGGGNINDWVNIITDQYNGSISGYYTKAESDGKYMTSTDPTTRDFDGYVSYIVFCDDSPYLPVNATVATTATDLNGLYIPAIGDGQVVQRDSSGDIYARDGYLTAVQAKYADLAEKYTCDDLPVGTIVGIGPSEKEVEQFNYDMSTVIGVVSENPALLMNRTSEGLPIALVGKVKVRVVGKVKKGDCINPDGSTGVGISGEYKDQYTFAYAIEDKDTVEESLVMCIIK